MQLHSRADMYSRAANRKYRHGGLNTAIKTSKHGESQVTEDRYGLHKLELGLMDFQDNTCAGAHACR